MSLFYDAKQASYKAHRAASNGAGITLVAGCGEYTATFTCAKRAAELLGHRGLTIMGDGIFESIPVYKIAHEEMHAAVAKLSTRYSVALVDLVCDTIGNRFVLIWQVMPHGVPADAPKPAKPPVNLDDY